MNYSQFLYMIPEAALTAALVILFVADFCSAKDGKRSWFNPLASLLLALVTVVCCYTTTAGEASAFGGMYQANAGVTVVKTILALGTFIVVLMSKAWITRYESRVREGEFYMLTVSTLLGMFMMMSAGHFLLFFLGLEMASVPLATMVAFDLHRNDSAEAAAKFILTATFSSGVMLFGISFLYGMCGTLYFDDVALQITRQGCTPLLLMGLVFFFSGLGFKISLVPFHFWTADTYQGAPTTVTGYLSVISKGAAAFTLLSILYHVFGTMIMYWQVLVMIVVVLSITIANLFAIRQDELKRFMAFSSISQAGYIMLAAVGTSWQMSASALAYYVLIYVVANMAVFTIISVVEQNNGGKTQISDYDGFYTTNPKLSFLMTLALFSLGGIPPVCGHVLEVLHLHGWCQGSRCLHHDGRLGLRRGLHRPGQHRHLALLLSEDCQGNVHPQERPPAPGFPERRQHKVCLSHLHRRRSALRYLQRHLQHDFRPDVA